MYYIQYFKNNNNFLQKSFDLSLRIKSFKQLLYYSIIFNLKNMFFKLFYTKTSDNRYIINSKNVLINN